MTPCDDYVQTPFMEIHTWVGLLNGTVNCDLASSPTKRLAFKIKNRVGIRATVYLKAKSSQNQVAFLDPATRRFVNPVDIQADVVPRKGLERWQGPWATELTVSTKRQPQETIDSTFDYHYHNGSQRAFLGTSYLVVTL